MPTMVCGPPSGEPAWTVRGDKITTAPTLGDEFPDTRLVRDGTAAMGTARGAAGDA